MKKGNDKDKLNNLGSGTLYLVATPIGNLEDITLRALRVLKEADLIAAEDTRETLKLLNHFGIKKPLTSYYEHNKVEKGNYLLEQLLAGKSIALVSDAGTPGISDPGEDLLGFAIKSNIAVTMVPGPAAVIMGVALSGLPSGRFCFEGFLPMHKRQRKERLNALKDEIRTMVFYEAPHKLIYTLRDLKEVLGNRKISLARELTKKFEEIIRADLDSAVETYEAAPPKGEFVLIVDGKQEAQLKGEKIDKWCEMPLDRHMSMYLEKSMDKKEAMKKVAEDRGISKRDVYRMLLDGESK